MSYQEDYIKERYYFSKEEEKIIAINPEYTIQQFDKLVLAGPNKNLEKLVKL